MCEFAPCKIRNTAAEYFQGATGSVVEMGFLMLLIASWALYCANRVNALCVRTLFPFILEPNSISLKEVIIVTIALSIMYSMFVSKKLTTLYTAWLFFGK